ncbi:MAG TPA: N-methyl-L-tryptophan oxidase [Pseudonocardia sp.]|jgi:sarcosine oxidase|uniref:N-methyl-L-tryptophan oxidase n=1 Tax=Pseudonocardia sp. TaxID=60912 RepID=UPI002B4AB014|nr:N-methyl-L-tryptophan oxidase [Pseudonocardia sp.]HLU56735.1 N-methyl-L-tryptophan oxidase [Pseudonocardia sp.]
MTIERLDADVAVIGLGAMGAMSAWRLARAGARVLGFEQFGIAHDRGAAGGESRLFRMAYHEGPEYVPLLRRARELWLELAAVSGRDLFLPTGCLSIGLPDLPPMVNVRRSVTDHDLEHEVLAHDELATRYPQHRLHEGEIGILDVAGGMLRPELAVLAAAQQARAMGARLHEHTPVRAIEPGGAGVTVVTDEARYRVRRVVVTAGPWTGELVPDVAVTVKPIVLTWFAPQDLPAYAPGAFPAFIRDTDGVHLFGCPVLDGMSVKCGFADVWPPLPGPRELTRDLPGSALRPISDAVRRFLPGLHPEPIRHGVYMDGYTPDRTAVVGPLPDAPSVVVLAGFSGHGFKMAPVFGSIAADLALEGGTDFDVTRMSPSRFGAAA